MSTAVVSPNVCCTDWRSRVERSRPKQIGQFPAVRRYDPRVPYWKSHELVMDIPRHGQEVEVVAPAALRDEVVNNLRQALTVNRLTHLNRDDLVS